jgi:ribonuclease P protein component
MRRAGPGPQRLLQRSQFQAAAQSGRRFRSSALTVQVRERASDAQGPQVGFTASRKTGTATERNRIRRRLKAAAHDAYGTERADLDIVAVATAAVLSARYDDLVTTLRDALTKARAQKKHQRDNAAPQPAREAAPVRASQETERS